MNLPRSRKDTDGRATRAGDIIQFCYGIPPVRVTAEIIERDGDLWALTPGHNPPECRLKNLKRHVGVWVRTGRKTP